MLETVKRHSIKANTSKRKKNKLVTLRTSLCNWECEMCRLQCRARSNSNAHLTATSITYGQLSKLCTLHQCGLHLSDCYRQGHVVEVWRLTTKHAYAIASLGKWNMSFARETHIQYTHVNGNQTTHRIDVRAGPLKKIHPVKLPAVQLRCKHEAVWSLHRSPPSTPPPVHYNCHNLEQCPPPALVTRSSTTLSHHQRRTHHFQIHMHRSSTMSRKTADCEKMTPGQNIAILRQTS